LLLAGIILNIVRFALEQSIKNSAYLISVWTELKFLGYCSDVSPITITKPNPNQTKWF